MLKNKIHDRLWIGQAVRMMINPRFTNYHDFTPKLFIPLLDQIGILSHRHGGVGLTTT